MPPGATPAPEAAETSAPLARNSNGAPPTQHSGPDQDWQHKSGYCDMHPGVDLCPPPSVSSSASPPTNDNSSAATDSSPSEPSSTDPPSGLLPSISVAAGPVATDLPLSNTTFPVALDPSTSATNPPPLATPLDSSAPSGPVDTLASSKPSHTAAIAGGVIGGLALLILIVLAVFFVVRRRRRKHMAPSAEVRALSPELISCDRSRTIAVPRSRTRKPGFAADDHEGHAPGFAPARRRTPTCVLNGQLLRPDF
jgi:hypothetical protein